MPISVQIFFIELGPRVTTLARRQNFVDWAVANNQAEIAWIYRKCHKNVYKKVVLEQNENVCRGTNLNKVCVDLDAGDGGGAGKGAGAVQDRAEPTTHVQHLSGRNSHLMHI